MHLWKIFLEANEPKIKVDSTPYTTEFGASLKKCKDELIASTTILSILSSLLLLIWTVSVKNAKAETWLRLEPSLEKWNFSWK